jgi:hypothetical protein
MAQEAGAAREERDSASQPLLSSTEVEGQGGAGGERGADGIRSNEWLDEERELPRRSGGVSVENDGSRPTGFVWLLTGVAGISGVLFGYE